VSNAAPKRIAPDPGGGDPEPPVGTRESHEGPGEFGASQAAPPHGLQEMQRLLEEWEFSYWLDSGSLLGLIRDGGEIAWDSDIDLGIWERDVPRVLFALPELRARGYKVSYRKYRGRVYGFTIKDKVEQRFRPIHIHVYFRDGDIAWSPQTVTYSPTTRPGAAAGFADWPRLRHALLTIKRAAITRRDGTALAKVAKWLLAYPVWGTFVVLRNRFDRETWTSVWPFSVMHAMYTWVVPASHFDRLEFRGFRGVSLPIPSDVESYLSQRYGDWRTPVADWCYWTDDGCICPVPPEDALSEALAAKVNG